MAVIGTFIIAILYIKGVKGSILIGILATWILGIICQLTGIYTVVPEAGYYSLILSWSSFSLSAIGLTFGQCFMGDYGSIKILDFFVIILALLFVDIFDILGTLIGCANKAGMLDKDGKLPRIKQALLADAIPAYLCLLTMPLLYSISEGIAVGVIAYVIINVICDKAKKITPLMYILAVLFICKYIFL